MDSREQEEQKIILQSSVNLANLFYSDQVFMSSSLQLSSQSTSLPSTSSNKHHPVTPESNDEKIRRYRERNRQAAKRSRDRKMAQLKQLEEQVSQLEKQHGELTKKIEEEEIILRRLEKRHEKLKEEKGKEEESEWWKKDDDWDFVMNQF